MTNEHKNQEWQDFLTQAATRCEVDAEAFLRSAWAAYFEAHPGLREHLEQLQLMADIEQLRKSGRIAQA